MIKIMNIKFPEISFNVNENPHNSNKLEALKNYTFELWRLF